MSKVVFLDVDGVLVTARTLKQRDGRDKVADDKCVYALNYLTHVAGAEIVVSSSWRFCGLNELRAIFDFWGAQRKCVSVLKTVNAGLAQWDCRLTGIRDGPISHAK